MPDAAAEPSQPIYTLADLKDVLYDLRVTKGFNDQQIADELDRRGVMPPTWTDYRARCVITGFKIFRKWGRKPKSERPLDRMHCEAANIDYSDMVDEETDEPWC